MWFSINKNAKLDDYVVNNKNDYISKALNTVEGIKKIANL